MTDETDILARTLWGEARGEGARGMEAVALVILNRKAVADQEGGYWWGNTVSEICLFPFQFTCWNAFDPNAEKIRNVGAEDKHFVIALEIAEDALGGLLISDPTHGATHYLNPSSVVRMPKWAKWERVRIGKHVFFRPKDVPKIKGGNPPSRKEEGSWLSRLLAFFLP
jgi:N-acetylmuramoyl-L-alanine amidase